MNLDRMLESRTLSALSPEAARNAGYPSMYDRTSPADAGATLIFELLTPDDAAKLIALHLVANIGRRRARFGAALNDEGVLRHCEALDWNRFFAVGAFVRRRMDAVVEIFRLGDDWRRAEVTATGMRNFQLLSAAALMAHAAQEARRRGCVELVWVEAAPHDPWRRALMCIGDAEARGADIVIRF
jgi:hypothetical protein